MLKENGLHPAAGRRPTNRRGIAVVTARYPNHVWHVDLTVVPTGLGFWCSWLPLALPQRWPFCWWVAVVVDHFSRRAMGCHRVQEPAHRPKPCGRSWAELLPRRKGRPGTSFATVAAVRLRWLPRLVPPQGHQAASLRGHWETRQHRRSRAIHLDAEVPAGLPAAGSLPTRQIPAGAQRDRALVQRRSSAHVARRQDARRGILRRLSRQPQSAFRAALALAARLALRQAVGIGAGQTGARVEMEVTFHAGRKHLPIVRLKRDRMTNVAVRRRWSDYLRRDWRTTVNIFRLVNEHSGVPVVISRNGPLRRSLGSRYSHYSSGFRSPSLRLSKVAGPGQHSGIITIWQRCTCD